MRKRQENKNKSNKVSYGYLLMTLYFIIVFMTTFVGTSYAWLSESVESNDNTITSGVWLYDIIYYLDNGVNNSVNPPIYSEFKTTPLSAPSRAGYSFEGWYNSSSYQGFNVTVIAEGTSGTLNLYALWATSGLSYTLINNGAGYSVSGGTAGSLSNIKIPVKHNGLPVTAISSSGFRNFTSLISIEIPEGIKTISSQALRGCNKLISVTLPSTTTLIDTNAFNGCSALTNVIIRNTNVITGSNGMFTAVAPSFKIFVPAASVQSYKSAPKWSSYASKIYGY